MSMGSPPPRIAIQVERIALHQLVLGVEQELAMALV
jgi:hypothetical protein